MLSQLLSALSAAISQQEHLSHPISLTTQGVRSLCSQACSTLHYLSTDSWLSVERNLCSAISHLESYDRQLEGRCSRELDLLAMLSRASVCVGVAQVHLLCPSPIDPIVTARTKHQCLQHLVSAGIKS